MLPQNFPVAWLFFGSAVLALVLAVFVRYRRRSATSVYFMLTLCLAAGWGLASGMHLVVQGLAAKAFWVDFKYIFSTTLPVTWFMTARAYAGDRRVLRLRTLLPYLMVPAITLVLIATNDWHHLVYVRNELTGTEAYTTIRRDYGFWFWVYVAYSYALYAGGVGVFISRVIRLKGYLRRQAVILACGPIVPVVLSLFFLSRQSTFHYLDFTPVAFSITGLLYFFALFRYRMFDLMPVAREQVVRVMEDAVIVTAADGTIADVNPAVCLLQNNRKDDCVGQFLVRAFPALEAVWDELRNEERYTHEVRIRKEAEWRWFQLTSLLLRLDDRDSGGYLIVLRDITQQKEVEAQLTAAKQKAEELSRLKSAFLSNMSHEIRTPLAGVIGLADILAEEVETDQHREFAAMIREGGERLLRMLNSVLSVAHLSSGNLKQKSVKVDVVDLCVQVASEFEHEASSEGVVFDLKLPNRPVHARLDPSHLTHALAHLLDNAFRYTREGAIRLEVTTCAEDLFIRVADTGLGFDASFVGSIGTEFHQVPAGHGLARHDAGVGLGLRVAFGLIEEMGGRISLESEPGQGSTFTIRMPLEFQNVGGIVHQRSLPGAAERKPTGRSTHPQNGSPVRSK